jgi:hypothetical protein
MRRLCIIAAVALTSGWAAASHGPPWYEGAPLPPDTRSARVLKSDQPLLAGPHPGAPRRGSAAQDVRLPVFASRAGPGCPAAWLQVGPLAWVCGDAVEPSPLPAVDPRLRTIPDSADGLPYRYFFVGPDGSLAYRRLDAADLGDPDMQLEPGFAVAIVAEQLVDGARYGVTQHGLWVPMRDLGAVRSFAFRGEVVPENVARIPFAWVIADRARVHTKPQAGSIGSATRARFEAVPVLDESSSFAGRYLKIAEGAWISANDVRHPVLAEPPSEVDVSAGERWIDVDLATQTLVAYEGKRPVFATLVSTGKGRQGSALATPKGVHRLWVKLLTSDMDNLEDENASRFYRMETVPYVQYFSKGVGLHGAFWHRSFGHVRSHGCVNLAPLDAQRLFWFTSPRLPAGWTAVIPTPHEPGTVVRVR